MKKTFNYDDGRIVVYHRDSGTFIHCYGELAIRFRKFLDNNNLQYIPGLVNRSRFYLQHRVTPESALLLTTLLK